MVIGRSPDCHITIEDPLISRQHAKIIVTEHSCTFVDLASRNGSRMNGRPVREPMELHDSDRIRIGAQELVFFEMSAERRMTRATGAMRLCSHCGSPFAEGAEVCPHCASPVVKEEDTMSGVVLEPHRTWVLELVAEVLDRAIAAGKSQEAERMLRRAAEEFSSRAQSGQGVDLRALSQISEYALRLAKVERDPYWVRWVADTYIAAQAVPPQSLVGAFLAAGEAHEESKQTLARLAQALTNRGSALSPTDSAVVASLAGLDRLQ